MSCLVFDELLTAEGRGLSPKAVPLLDRYEAAASLAARRGEELEPRAWLERLVTSSAASLSKGQRSARQVVIGLVGGELASHPGRIPRDLGLTALPRDLAGEPLEPRWGTARGGLALRTLGTSAAAAAQRRAGPSTD